MASLSTERWREKTVPEGTFTEYVRSLERGEPDARGFAALREALRAALRAELRRRGLWNSPPSYLGIFGWRSWDERTSSGEDALEELRAEAYPFIFITRSRSLRNHLAIQADIDGLVVLAVRQFVQAQQEKHDPLGAQVYAVLRAAVREALKAGDLHLLAGSERIGNDTVLGFVAGAAPEAPGGDFRPLAARWNGLLLPGLVTNRGVHQGEVVQRLRELLPELRHEGGEVFRFKDLIDPMKSDLRARWAAAFEQERGETGLEEGEEDEVRRVPLVLPDLWAEERQFLEKVIACVLESIAGLNAGEKVRGYLYRLWQFRRMQAALGEERTPSARKLGDLLGVPRERVSELFGTLDKMANRCRALHSGRLAVTSFERDSIHGTC
jgi:hypothetical protein